MNSFNQILTINIKPTIGRKLIVFLPHFGVFIFFIIALNLSGLTASFILIPLLSIFVSLIYYTRLNLTQSLKNSVYAIHKDLNNNWSLIFKDKRKVMVSIAATSFISNFFIVLNFVDASNRQEYTTILTPDSFGNDDFRRLKVLVKTSKGLES